MAIFFGFALNNKFTGRRGKINIGPRWYAKRQGEKIVTDGNTVYMYFKSTTNRRHDKYASYNTITGEVNVDVTADEFNFITVFIFGVFFAISKSNC